MQATHLHKVNPTLANATSLDPVLFQKQKKKRKERKNATIWTTVVILGLEDWIFL